MYIQTNNYSFPRHAWKITFFIFTLNRIWSYENSSSIWKKYAIVCISQESKDRKIKLRVSKHIWSCEFLFYINTVIKIYYGCLPLARIFFIALTHFDIISIVNRSILSDRSQILSRLFIVGAVKYCDKRELST